MIKMMETIEIKEVVVPKITKEIDTVNQFIDFLVKDIERKENENN